MKHAQAIPHIDASLREPGTAGVPIAVATHVSLMRSLVTAFALWLVATQAYALTVDDLSRLESFGGVQVSPDGKWIAYERNVSAAERPGVYWPHNWNATRVRVSSVDRADSWPVEIEGAVAIGLFPAASAWSPDSSVFVVRVLDGTGSGAALVNPRTRQVTRLRGSTPFTFGQFLWLADGRLLYATSNGRFPGAVPIGEFTRARTERWKKTAEGREAQVTVSSASPVVKAVAAIPVLPGGLNLFDPRTGESVKLADGDFISLQLSPDGKRIATLCLTEDMRTRASFGIYWETLSGELCVFRIQPARLTLEFRSEGLLIYPKTVQWSPDSRELLVNGRGERDDLYDPKIYRYRSAQRRLEPLATPPDSTFRDFGLRAFGMHALPYGWAGSTPVAVAARKNATESRSGDLVREHSRLTYGEYDGYRFDVWALGQKPINLTEFSSGSVMSFAPASGGIRVSADGELWQIQANGKRERVTEAPKAKPNSTPKGFSPVAEAGPVQIGLLTDAHDVRSLVSVRNGEVTVLDTVNAFLRDHPPSNRRQIEFKVGGETRRAWVVLPPQHDPSRRYPGVLLVYGGTIFGDAVSWFVELDQPVAFYNANVLAARGFVVIVPELPLQPGHKADQGRSLADAAVAVTDAAAELGLVDPARMGVMGSSFGAYSTLSILSHASDRFKAGVADNPAGTLNPISAWGTQHAYVGLGHAFHGSPIEEFPFAGFQEGGQIGLGAPPWEAPELYVTRAPFFRVQHIKAPVMLFASDLDGSLADAESMFAALVRSGNEAVLVHYWGESHAVVSPANQRDQMDRITAWFEAHLR